MASIRVAFIALVAAFAFGHPVMGSAVGRPLMGRQGAPVQERGPTPVSPEQIRQAIGKLGDLEYPTRMSAGRTLRRAPAAQVVPALMQAANEHADGFIRFRSLILLTGFNDPRMPDMMEEMMASPNDRLREVGYAYFELHPERPLVPRMLVATPRAHPWSGAAPFPGRRDAPRPRPGARRAPRPRAPGSNAAAEPSGSSP